MPGHNGFASPHRFTQGSFEITILSDGFIALPADIIMPEIDETRRGPILAKLGGGRSSAPMDTNIPIIRKGSELIVVDTGSGIQFQETAGAFEPNLAAAGVDPLAVTKVVLTHAHPDHMGGVVRPDGSLLFPHAQHFISGDEWYFWRDDEKLADGLRPFAAGARDNFKAIGDRLTIVNPGHEIVTGIEVVGTPGHTGGHISLLLEGAEGLLITGDALTNPVISFEHPDWRFGFDADHEMAVRTRKLLLDRFATSRAKLLGYHWKYPGVGRVEWSGGQYRLITEDV
ncbi:MBL fold metallo-hydrolase [Rhizobium sp. BE258]|uniref:MBL fold metallo-hydrolase n=1 Tax=Rhizobium sp. BE258 TaxID=2817722 RepID=UPI000DD8748F|nr:MBL fold metallo-hydrolase [Rhizobium sp. BE258]MDR7145024.1 glyoxylase-like metal-dependent hydrolase (beta-lactamase superfamily II) [Rhizobium sp. BE258]